MTVLAWGESQNVGIGFMDADHLVAADLINQMAATQAIADRIAMLEHFIEHCREHFGREEAMMQETGFFAMHCHQDEHHRVLEQLQSVLQALKTGNAQDSYFQTALPGWLQNHRDTMDYVTADFARARGKA